VEASVAHDRGTGHPGLSDVTGAIVGQKRDPTADPFLRECPVFGAVGGAEGGPGEAAASVPRAARPRA